MESSYAIVGVATALGGILGTVGSLVMQGVQARIDAKRHRGEVETADAETVFRAQQQFAELLVAFVRDVTGSMREVSKDLQTAMDELRKAVATQSEATDKMSQMAERLEKLVVAMNGNGEGHR